MKSFCGGPIGTRQRSFERYHLRPPLPQDWRFATQPKTAIAIISVTGKATDCKFGRYIQRVHLNISRWIIWEKRERGCIQGLPNFFQYSLLSQELVKLRTSNLAGTLSLQRLHTNKSPLKIWKKREQWSTHIFEYPPIISGMGKATNFKFCTHSHRIDRNKSTLKISAQVGP